MTPRFARIKNGPVPALVAISASTAVLAAVIINGQSDTPPAVNSEPEIFMTESLEASASTSIKDWAAVADTVATVTITSEQKVELGDSSANMEPIGRDVTVRVDDVLWNSPVSSQQAPSGEFSLTTYGWMRQPDGQVLEMAAEGASRLEVGHQYLIALRAVTDTCTDSLPSAARWVEVGSGAVLPADGGIIGRGEFEGTVSQGTGPAVAQNYQERDVEAVARGLSTLNSVTRLKSPPTGAASCE